MFFMLEDKDFQKTTIISSISVFLGTIVAIVTNIGNINFSFYQSFTFSIPIGFSSELIIFAYVVTHDNILEKMNSKRLWIIFIFFIIFFIVASTLIIFDHHYIQYVMSNNSIFNISNFVWVLIIYFVSLSFFSYSFFYAFFAISLMLYRYIIKKYVK